MKTLDKAVLGVLLVLIVSVGSIVVASLATDRSLLEVVSSLGDGEEDEAEGEDVAITGDALEKASVAALTHIGDGRVTDTEVGDEEGYYEVEVTLSDGREVDVHLDENFQVLSVESDDNEEGDDE